MVFLDILGTTDSMPRLDDSALRDRLLLLDRLRWFIVSEGEGLSHQQALSHSDSLGVGEPVRAGDELLQLGPLAGVGRVVSTESREPRGFLRGGVVRVPLYLDGRVAIGQALIDAYTWSRTERLCLELWSKIP